MVYGILQLPNVKILSLIRVSQEARFTTSRGKFCYIAWKQKSSLLLGLPFFEREVELNTLCFLLEDQLPGRVIDDV